MWPLFLRAEQVGPMVKFLQSLMLIATLSSRHVPPDPHVADGADYDFIVVGAGTAGAVVAVRLAQAGQRVLLVEAGGHPPLQAEIPGLFPLVAGSEYDWQYEADTGPDVCRMQKDKLKLVQGKMLGGSSGANYMHHALGHPADYDAWAALAGDPSWAYQNMAQYIQDIESVHDEDILNSPHGHLRGRHGSINITRQVHRKQTLKYFKAFFEAGHKISHDYNTAHSSFSEGQFTIGGGRRSSSTAYLKHTHPNLDVLTHTEVKKVLFEGNKAVAVQATTKQGKTITIKAKAEIILSAGAINTPLILMQSGIGPKTHLQEHNIEVLADLPVGENLQDHVTIPIALTGDNSSVPDPTTIHEFPLPTIVGFVSLNKTGIAPDYQVLAYTAARGSKYPLLICSSIGIRDDICNHLDDAAAHQQIVLVQIVLLHPQSRGRVRLSTTKQPSIYMGYYDVEQDLERHVTYIEDFLRVLNTTFFRSVGSKVVDLQVRECAGEEFGSRGYWSCYARSLAVTMYHPAGTAALGAALDARLLVRGTRRLRVADAAAVPHITSGSINAPVTLLAEHAARLIKEDHGITD